jgi:hypothetical protein
VNAREETAKAYDIWALQHLSMYERRADPTPPLPEVSRLAFAACGVEQRQPPVDGFAFMLQWVALPSCCSGNLCCCGDAYFSSSLWGYLPLMLPTPLSPFAAGPAAGPAHEHLCICGIRLWPQQQQAGPQEAPFLNRFLCGAAAGRVQEAAAMP